MSTNTNTNMNLETYLKQTNFKLKLNLPKDEATKLLKVLKNLEQGKDSYYNLNPKDRGLTVKDFNHFVKVLIRTNEYDRRMSWLRSWVCMMGPLAYKTVKEALKETSKDRNSTKTIDNFF